MDTLSVGKETYTGSSQPASTSHDWKWRHSNLYSCSFAPMYLGTRTIASGADTKKSRTTRSAMVQWALSRTLSLLGIAILVHLIVMTSVAEKGKLCILLSLHTTVIHEGEFAPYQPYR